jgi:hypothetical protein
MEAISAFSFSDLNFVCVYVVTEDRVFKHISTGKNLEAYLYVCVFFQNDALT